MKVKNLVSKSIILANVNELKSLVIDMLNYIGEYASKHKLSKINVYHYTKYETSILHKVCKKLNIKISSFQSQIQDKIQFYRFSSKN